MPKFYFTYGTDEQFPYQDGWTEITAPNQNVATGIFKAVHPCHTDGILNCSFVYPEKQFRQTEMFTTGKNFNMGCVEKITLAMEKTLQPNDKNLQEHHE